MAGKQINRNDLFGGSMPDLGAVDMNVAISPNGGPSAERERLLGRFASRLSVRDDYSRKMVSYQGNRDVAGLRWMKYKEGFSRQLVADLIAEHDPKDVLDPFMGIGTTPLVAAGSGRRATGIDIMPVGVMVGTAIAEAANGLSAKTFERKGREMVGCLRGRVDKTGRFSFPHIPITAGAFPEDTEQEIATARAFLSRMRNKELRDLLNMACISILESVSYTRKDGQYLRWDSRSGRPLRSGVDKGPIPSFSDALEQRLAEMVADIGILKEE